MILFCSIETSEILDFAFPWALEQALKLIQKQILHRWKNVYLAKECVRFTLGRNRIPGLVGLYTILPSACAFYLPCSSLSSFTHTACLSLISMISRCLSFSALSSFHMISRCFITLYLFTLDPCNILMNYRCAVAHLSLLFLPGDLHRRNFLHLSCENSRLLISIISDIMQFRICIYYLIPRLAEICMRNINDCYFSSLCFGHCVTLFAICRSPDLALITTFPCF